MSTFVEIEGYISIYGPFLLTSLGVIGNILSVLIFLSPRYRRQSSHFYLLSLALSDLCFLLINVLEDTFRNHDNVYRSRINFLDRSSHLTCILVEYARNVSRSLSSWIIVSFTVERLLVVFHPLQRAIICRRKIARTVVFVLFCLTLLNHLNVPFHYGIIPRPDERANETICDILPQSRKIYMRFAIGTMLTVYLLPMCIIGVVNLAICAKLWTNSSSPLIAEEDRLAIPRQRKCCSTWNPSKFFSRWQQASSSSPRSSSSSIIGKQTQARSSSLSQYQSIGHDPGQIHRLSVSSRNGEPHRDIRSHSLSALSAMRSKGSTTSIKTYLQTRTHRVTATLLLVSCSFLLLNTPYCAIWIVNYIGGFQNDTWKSLKEISELFMLTNFCINFLLYCVSGKVFRSELICLLRCQWKDLYDRNELDQHRRVQRRTTRPQIEIQLQPSNYQRSMSLHPQTSSYMQKLSIS